MEDRIDIADRLKKVSLDLAGISQLLFFSYEKMNAEQADAEHLLVLCKAAEQCREELDDLRETL